MFGARIWRQIKTRALYRSSSTRCIAAKKSSATFLGFQNFHMEIKDTNDWKHQKTFPKRKKNVQFHLLCLYI